MKYLPPLPLKQSYYLPVEEEINLYFRTLIYLPMREAIAAEHYEISNAADPLTDAIRAGRVYFENGIFKGEFSAAISKQLKAMGAKYSIFRKGWIYAGIVPPAIQTAVAFANDKMNRIISSLIKTIDDMKPEVLAAKFNFARQYEKTITEIDFAFQQSVKAVTIAPKLTAEAVAFLSQAWAKNLKLYIVNWSNAEILSLREKVLANSMQGRRAEALEKMIQSSYGSSKAKAKFLARQETSLLMSSLRKQRYEDIGVLKYRWSGADDERERPDHLLLNGKVFTWENPPITNRETGARNHPGEDFGCRCVAIPIFEGDLK